MTAANAGTSCEEVRPATGRSAIVTEFLGGRPLGPLRPLAGPGVPVASCPSDVAPVSRTRSGRPHGTVVTGPTYGHSPAFVHSVPSASALFNCHRGRLYIGHSGRLSTRRPVRAELTVRSSRERDSSSGRSDLPSIPRQLGAALTFAAGRGWYSDNGRRSDLQSILLRVAAAPETRPVWVASSRPRFPGIHRSGLSSNPPWVANFPATPATWKGGPAS